MNKAIVNFFKFLFFLGIGVGILYIVYRNQNASFLADCIAGGSLPEECPPLWQKILNDFKSVKFFWIAMVMLAFMISNWSRASRWNMLIEPLGYRPRLSNAFLSVIIGYLANLALPRIGEVVRAGTMARYERIAAEKVMGTIVVDRAVDLLSMAVVIGLALLVEFDTLWGYLSSSGRAGTATDSSFWQSPLFWICLAGGLALWVGYLLREQLKKSPLYIKLANIVRGFAEGLRSIGKLERPSRFILHSINVWLMYYLMTYLCFFAFEPTSGLGMKAGLMVFVFGALGILIPSPGGMGTYQWLAVQALALYNIEGDDAFSFANILFFSVQIGCNVIFGIIAWLLLPLINKEYQPVHLQSSDHVVTTER